MDEDIILDIIKRLGLPIPSHDTVERIGPIEKPADVIRLIEAEQALRGSGRPRRRESRGGRLASVVNQDVTDQTSTIGRKRTTSRSRFTLLLRIDRHLRLRRMSQTRFGREAVGDPNLIPQLRSGRELRAATAQRIVDYPSIRAPGD
ncbi:MAG: hypothetical protein H0T60_19715 [Acidobacteria bacterium]|nr:hypothetical protein [Acidobacteriota bacterium]